MEMDMLQPILLPSLCWVVLSKELLGEYLSNYAMIGRNWMVNRSQLGGKVREAGDDQS